jgi:HNH endonuclease
MARITLREPLALDLIPNLHNSVISFHHPGYPDNVDNILFQLNGFDTPEGGLHSATAWLACAIVAGNKWQGFLTAQPSDSPRLAVSMDEVLTNSDYWFHVPDCSIPYPVVPSFQDWNFPHKCLPPWWVHSPPPGPITSHVPPNPSSAAHACDRYCRITQSRDCVEAAHVCPSAESTWSANNRMLLYSLNKAFTNITAMDGRSNRLLLRRDLRAGFDNKRFVIVPKSEGGQKWVVHLMEVTHELGKLYHNTPLHDIRAVAPEFLLVRFAWTIFPRLRGFFSTTGKRWVIRSEFENGELGFATSCVEGDDLRQYSNPHGRKGKRKRSRESSATTEEAGPANKGRKAPPTAPPDLAFNLRLPPRPSSESEYEQDIEMLRRILPKLLNEDETSDSHDYHWQNIMFYPGWRKMERLRESGLRAEREKSGVKRRKVEGEGIGSGGDMDGEEWVIADREVVCDEEEEQGSGASAPNSPEHTVASGGS